MKKTVAEKWVKALRSKKYKQAKNVLKIKNKSGVVRHCCLGVLCELYQQDMRKKKQKPLPVTESCASEHDPDFPKSSRIFDFANGRAFLPEKVKRWAGMRTTDGHLKDDMIEIGDKRCFNLAEINDNGSNFQTIAAVIETLTKEL